MPFLFIAVTLTVPRLERQRRPGTSGETGRAPLTRTPLHFPRSGGTGQPVSPGQHTNRRYDDFTEGGNAVRPLLCHLVRHDRGGAHGSSPAPQGDGRSPFGSRRDTLLPQAATAVRRRRSTPPRRSRSRLWTTPSYRPRSVARQQLVHPRAGAAGAWFSTPVAASLRRCSSTLAPRPRREHPRTPSRAPGPAAAPAPLSRQRRLQHCIVDASEERSPRRSQPPDPLPQRPLRTRCATPCTGFQ